MYLIIKINSFLTKYRYFLLSIIFLISIAIFQFNFLYTAGSKNFFDTPSMNLEVEVTDGIINGNITGVYGLGRYDRENNLSNDYRKYKLFFKENNSKGEFKRYNTSYGLQVKIYGYLNKNFSFNLFTFNLINTLILSLILILFSIVLSKKFSQIAVFSFLITYVLSPWNISFAKEIRLIEWTWLLPIFLIFCLNIIITKSNKYYFKSIIYFLIYLSLLLKCLISYEFITSIVFFIIFIQLYFSFLNYNSIKIFIFEMLIISFIILFSIITALYIHIFMNYQNDIFYEFYNRFIYNFNFFNKSNYIDCNSLVVNNNLQYEYIALCVSRLEVFFRYFLFRNFLPFLGYFENYLNNDIKLDIVKMMLNKNYFNFYSLFLKYDFLEYFPLFILLLNFILFISFLIFATYAVIKNRNNYLIIIIIGGFISSSSWFLIAKTYSYVHFHLCFVSWTFIFIPFTTLALFEIYLNGSINNKTEN